MSQQVDDLKAAVAANTSAVDSAVLLLKKLADLYRAVKDDPVAIAALSTEITQKAQALAEANVANTPAEP